MDAYRATQIWVQGMNISLLPGGNLESTKPLLFRKWKKKKHWIFLINHFVKVDIVALWSDIINILPKSDLNGATRFLNSKFQKNLEYIRVLSVIGKAAYEVVNASHYVFINL